MLLRPGRDEEYLLKKGKLEAFDVGKSRVMTIHYGVDPEKDEAWAVEKAAEVPNQVWQREYEGRIRVYDGVPVWPEYRTMVHEVADIPWPSLNQLGYLIAGWDCGNTLNPAFIVAHLTPKPFQLHVLMEVLPPEGEVMAMNSFAARVWANLREVWPSVASVNIRHKADPSGAARQGAQGGSAFDEARAQGFVLSASTNNLQKRIGTVSGLLMDWINEESPRVVISRKGCPRLCAAMAGGYRMKAKELPDGARIIELPDKNEHSHIADAFQYLCIEAKRIIDGESEGRILRRGHHSTS